MSKMSGWRRAWFALGLVAVVICSMLLGMITERGRLSKYWEAATRSNNQMAQLTSDIQNLERYLTLSDKMVQTVSAIRSYYVDQINLDTIYDRAIPMLLSELDPHSEYSQQKIIFLFFVKMESRTG